MEKLPSQKRYKKPKSPPTDASLTSKRAEAKKEILAIVGALAVGGAAAGAIALGKIYNVPLLPGDDGHEVKTAGHEPSASKKNTLPPLQYSHIEPFRPTATNEIDQMLELQEYWKTITSDALSLFQEAAPEVPKLQAFMKKNAFYSIPLGPIATQRTTRKMEDLQTGPQTFEIVFMPEMYAQNMPSAIVTTNSGNTLKIATNFKIKEWLGIMLAHELSHIYDQKVEGENSEDPEQNAAGEVKAHTLEDKLVKFWNPEIYKILLEKGIPLWQQKKIPEMKKLAASLYPLTVPEVSPNEASLGTFSIFMSIILTEARQRGLSDQDLKKVYRETIKFFEERQRP